MKTKDPKKPKIDTRFQPGQSGNPGGRPKRSVAEKNLRQIATPFIPGIIETFAQKALKGDLEAAKFVVGLVLSPLKPQTPPINHPLPEGDIQSRMQYAFEAAAQGDISIEQAEGLNQIGERAVNISHLQASDLQQSSNFNSPEIANDYTMDQSSSPTNTGVTVIERKTLDSLIAEPDEVLDKSIQDTDGSNENS